MLTLRAKGWAHNTPWTGESNSPLCRAGAVLTLVIKFFYMAFQNSPLFSDAVCKLLSHSITGKSPHTLSVQLSSIFFNIRDNLQHEGEQTERATYGGFPQVAVSHWQNLIPNSCKTEVNMKTQKLPNLDRSLQIWVAEMSEEWQPLSVQCCVGCCHTLKPQTVQGRTQA